MIFEPSAVGAGRAKLVISHPLAGTYICNIHGTCMAPKPQGPLSIKSGNGIKIAFKNVYKDIMPYTFTLDNALFSVKPTTENIAGKTTTQVLIS